MEKEALAIMRSLDKLRYYLLGREFTLVTDHAPLKWMAGAKDSKARVTRWFLALQDFRFKVDHQPGKDHANANALSRQDACLGWTPGDQRLWQTGKECGIPLSTRGTRGLVVDRIYRRHPLAGGREHHWSPRNQPDGGHQRSGQGRHQGVVLLDIKLFQCVPLIQMHNTVCKFTIVQY